jgi:polar amino acid transport system substrate-binding protein
VLYRKVLLLITLFLTIIFIPLQVKADTKKVIKVAGDENYPPYEYVDKSGYYKGFNIDIMNAISSNLGRDIQVIPMAWEKAINALESGEVDAIQGMTRSSIREEKFSFSEALAKNSQAIFVKSDRNNIFGLNDLAALTVAVQCDDISEECLVKVPGVKTIIYNNQEEAINALLEGEVDAFVGNRLTGLYTLQNMKEYNKIKIVGEAIHLTDYSSAVLKGNKEILNLLNQGLNNIKKNGEYDKIYYKWFGETLVDKSAALKRARLIFGTILIGILAVIALVSYWNRSLKRLVTIRTSELAAANKELYIHKESLERSNRLRGKVLESILDGIIVFDKEGEALVVNQSARKLLKFDNEEEGKKIEDFRFINDFVLERYFQALRGSIWRKNIEWKKDDGEILNIDCGIYPIKGPGELVEGMVVVLHDYTESKLLNEAKEYDKLKTEFFANISHELRTPLTIMHAAAQLLEVKSENTSDDNLKISIDKSVSSIKQNINRLARLINNIIDLTKVDTGFLQLHLKNYNIVSIIEEVTMSTVNLIENKGISIQFDTDIEEKIIACDVDKIERIILNLLSNSVKFTPEGGSIFVKVTDGKEFVTISVKDTGIGIPKDKQQIIFERFRQVDKTISRTNEGSGIGLSLVKSLVELHNGYIDLKSSYGCGSEFIIKLPVRRLKDCETDYEIGMFNAGKTEMEFSDI